jgi:hypothetical protein
MKEETMNKEQKQIVKRINQAYSKLYILSNITWTPYRDEVFNINRKEEKQHRFNRSSSDFEASINEDINYLANLDYISLIDWKHYQEILERRSA